MLSGSYERIAALGNFGLHGCLKNAPSNASLSMIKIILFWSIIFGNNFVYLLISLTFVQST